MITTARQLKDLIRNLSKKKSADAQILMRNYMMERFLERIALSDYKDRFILKGGMLVGFKLMLEERSIEVWAYNLETVLAEKLETVISRNVTNTRMRDFYDIHILRQIYGESLSAPVLRDALAATAKKRGTLQQMQEAEAVFDEVEESPVMEKLWQSYQKNYSYATDLSWHTVMDSVRALYRAGGSI